MSHWEHEDGRDVLLMTRYDKDSAVQRSYNKKGEISNQADLYVGMPGSGKSVFANTTAHKHYKQGRTVIYCSDKPGAEYDNAFCLFPQENEQLLYLMSEYYSVHPYTKEQCSTLAKLYHPCTDSIPAEKLPEITFFSFALSTLGDDSIASLFKGDKESQAYDNVKREISALGKNDGVFKLIWQVNDAIGSSSDKSPKMNAFGLPIPLEGTERTKQSIVSSFNPFLHHYFLHAQSSEFVLDFVDVLNDNKHMHFFSTRWITDARLRVIFIIMLVEHINEALKTGKVKHDVLLVFEEIKVLLPKESRQEFEKALSVVFMKLLSTIRSKAYVIATTQEYFQTDDAVASSFTERFFGKLSPEDKKKMYKDFNIGADRLRLLHQLEVGQFIRLSDLESKRPRIGQAPLPPFSIQEEGISFFQKYPQVYPEKMRSYTEEKKNWQLLREHEENKAKERYEALMRKRAREKEQEQAQKERTTQDLKVRKENFDRKEKIMRDVWQFVSKRKNNGLKENWAKTGRRFSIDGKTAKRYFTTIDERMQSDQGLDGSAQDDAVDEQEGSDSKD